MKKKSVLYVEGKDDCYVISNLCSLRNVEKNFEIKFCDSKDNAIMSFELAINEQSSQIDNVGIVIDADMSIKKTWQKIKSKLKDCGNYFVPEEILSEGLTLDSKHPHKPIVAVWIMPNNNVNGMLEDFLALLTEEDDLLMDEAEKVLTLLEKKQIQKYKPVHRAKAKIHTFLAWHDKPGRPMGQAITSKILNSQSQQADIFINWIEKSFKKS